MTTRRYCFFPLLLVALLAGRRASTAEQCAPGVPRHAPNPITGDECPVLGAMGGAKLAIPSEYLLGPIAYKGIDIWKPDSYRMTPRHSTLENAIDTFAIRIRQTNFKPIEAESDLRAYRQSYESVRQLPPPGNRWIHIGFDARNYPRPPSREFAQTWRDELGKRGAYNKQPDAWGLAHYISTRLPSADNRFPGFGIQWEYFYDESQDSSFIECRTTLRKVPPHDSVSFCTIYFNAPEIKARAEITNIRDKGDLRQWRAMETGVLRTLGSFVVR
jgi:hypothetical protein